MVAWSALENAVSIAWLMLTTQSIVGGKSERNTASRSCRRAPMLGPLRATDPKPGRAASAGLPPSLSHSPADPRASPAMS